MPFWQEGELSRSHSVTLVPGQGRGAFARMLVAASSTCYLAVSRGSYACWPLAQTVPQAVLLAGTAPVSTVRRPCMSSCVGNGTLGVACCILTCTLVEPAWLSMGQVPAVTIPVSPGLILCRMIPPPLRGLTLRLAAGLELTLPGVLNNMLLLWRAHPSVCSAAPPAGRGRARARSFFARVLT